MHIVLSNSSELPIYEQIKEQIVIEGKTDISFWVRAHYDGELGAKGLTLGFHWIEQGVKPADAYSMLDLFNAITGQPAFCASITGIPNPSYEDGYDKQNTELYIFCF